MLFLVKVGLHSEKLLMVISGLDLANLDGENGFIIPGSYSNGTVSTGNINGDDLSDLIISDDGYDEGRGKVYVVLGTETGFDTNFDLTSLDGDNGFTIAGNKKYEYGRLGEALASGGDLNGDGFDDLIIASMTAGKTFYENDSSYSEEQGEVYVIFGAENGFDASFDLTSLNGDNGFTIPGTNRNDRLGNAVDSTGDLNGDGFDDLVVSGQYSREAQVIFGAENDFDANFDLTSLNGNNGFTIPDIAGVYNVSSSYSHAGDLNGDGLSDLAISSLEDEKVYVIFGAEDGFDASFDLASLDGNNGLTIASIDRGDRLGDAVSNAGDLNGDGLSDLIIGAPWSGETANEGYGLGRGKAYVIFGTEAGFEADFDLNSLDGDNGFAISGIDIDDNLGDAVSNAGDLDGDGFDDLIISATSAEESIKLNNEQSDRQNQLGVAAGYSDRQIQGEAYVIFGTEAGFEANFDLTSLNGENGFAIKSIDESGGFGSAINSAGDLNNDGFDDLVISSFYDGANAGYVVFGSPELKQIRTIEELPSLSNPVVTVLDDEDDGDLSINDLSLREAILYSNDGDTINFDPSLSNGTILLSLGQLNIDKNLTIKGFTDAELTIDGSNNSRVFNVDDNFNQIVDVTIENLTITGGNASNQSGGGIRNEENLTINDSIITGNSARLGGGVYSSMYHADEYNSATTINNTVISNNSAEDGGGGIYNYNSGFNSLSLSLQASIVSGNSTDGSGGGINNSSGRIKINESTIEQNAALYSGGGIDSSGILEIVNSTINSNRADSGGGFDSRGFDGYATVTNSTISGNTATTRGGGISVSNPYSTNTVTNSTITENSAPTGGGIIGIGAVKLEITSSIIADNEDNKDVQGASLISGGNNLIGNGDGAPAFINRFDGDIVGTAINPIDPKLGELQDNDGATLTHALLPESIAINTGSNLEKLTTDQRGQGFERVLFDAPDIGAFESDSDSIYELPILPPEPIERIVTILDDEDDGDLSADDISLREAILTSNPGDTITFDRSLGGGTITLTLGELAVNNSLTIRGLGADNLTIDADNNSRVFNVDDGSKTLIDVTIAKLTITGGNAIAQSGGGINNQENLIVNEAIITGNSADFSGAGVSTNDSATTTINNSTISNNSADYNGGGISNSSSTTTINNSTISDNFAERLGGGVSGVSLYGGKTILSNSTISGNSTSDRGGGIGAFDTTVEVRNSTVTDNAAKNSGSGIYVDLSSSTFTSSIIAGNANNDDIEGGGRFTSGGNNLIGNNSDVNAFTNGIKQDLVGTADNLLDPKLAELQDNGGLTFTHALLPDSPAINTGNNPNELTTDQRGEGFERILFDATDIGAFEADTDSIYKPKVLPPNPVVTILDDEDDNDLSADDISLREAILYSDAEDTISFDSSLSGGTIALTLGQLIIEKDLTINGLGADNLTIDANKNSRVLKIDDTTDDSINVTLDGITITGGFSQDSTSNFYARAGGGIYNQENLIITNSIITNNLSQGDGGGIYNRGTIEIDSSTIADNSAKSALLGNASGGGISNADQTNDGSITMRISNSTISGNTAQGNGGGIANGGGYYYNPSQTVIINSTISGNTAQGNGGGIYSIYRNTQVQNSTISNNSVTSESSLGSGIYHHLNIHNEPDTLSNDSTTLVSSIVAGNNGDRDIGSNSIFSNGYNLIGTENNLDFSDGVDGDLVGTADNLLDPKLGELKDNGGLTQTQALLPDSAAINAGSNPQELTTDQRGLERSVEQTDMGAYEVQPESPDLANYTIINGDVGDDSLTGTAKRDILNGNAGDDTLNSGEQFDRLYGGAGDDTLIGGGGINVLAGDEGEDLFYLEKTEGSLEWIRDFELGTDIIGLADGITYDELEITGRVNSFIEYQGNEIAVVLRVSPSQLTNDQFQKF